MLNRNRKGRFTHFDRERRTPAERRDFRQAEAQLIATFHPILIASEPVNLRQVEITLLRQKAGATKSAVNKAIFEAEIQRLEGG